MSAPSADPAGVEPGAGTTPLPDPELTDADLRMMQEMAEEFPEDLDEDFDRDAENFYDDLEGGPGAFSGSGDATGASDHTAVGGAGADAAAASTAAGKEETDAAFYDEFSPPPMPAIPGLDAAAMQQLMQMFQSQLATGSPFMQQAIAAASAASGGYSPFTAGYSPAYPAGSSYPAGGGATVLGEDGQHYAVGADSHYYPAPAEGYYDPAASGQYAEEASGVDTGAVAAETVAPAPAPATSYDPRAAASRAAAWVPPSYMTAPAPAPAHASTSAAPAPAPAPTPAPVSADAPDERREKAAKYPVGTVFKFYGTSYVSLGNGDSRPATDAEKDAGHALPAGAPVSAPSSGAAVSSVPATGMVGGAGASVATAASATAAPVHAPAPSGTPSSSSSSSSPASKAASLGVSESDYQNLMAAAAKKKVGGTVVVGKKWFTVKAKNADGTWELEFLKETS